MRSVAIFQRDLSVGGIQRSLLNLLSVIDKSSYDIDLFLFSEPQICSRNELKDVNLYVLKPLFYLNRVVDIRILSSLCRYDLPKKHYDVAIDFSSYSNECAVCVRQVSADKKILWVHNDLKLEFEESLKYRMLFRAFRKKYNYYSKFVAVSEGVVAPFCEMTGVKPSDVCVIPNVIDTETIFRKSQEEEAIEPDTSKLNFVFVGRLVHQKGVDILLNEFKRAYEKRKDIHLYVIGDGPERSALERQAESLYINNAVTFTGYRVNPYPLIAKMDALVLTSRHEGQGIVLLEGKALSLQVIFPEHLQKYCPYLPAVSDVAQAMIDTQRQVKCLDDLSDYNEKIKSSLYKLLG